MNPSRRAFALMVGASTALPNLARAALFPPGWMETVVAIGFEDVNLKWNTTGTGFFYGSLTTSNADPTKRLYTVYLVTAGHVVRMYKQQRKPDGSPLPMQIRVNPKADGTPARQFDLGDIDLWTFHPLESLPKDDPEKVDLAVLPINSQYLRDNGLQFEFFAGDTQGLGVEALRNTGVSPGDGIFVLGFPMGLSGVDRTYAISRSGSVARIGDLYDHATPKFMIDCFVFPGNSGGPVILRPDLVSIQGTSAQMKSSLIGVVVEYTPYRERAVSPQSGEERVLFEENSGLADVVAVDYIDQSIAAAASRPAPAAQPAPRTPHLRARRATQPQR